MSKWVELLKFNESSDELDAFPIPIDGMSLNFLKEKIDDYIDEYMDENQELDVKDIRFVRHYEHRGHCSNCSESVYWWSLEGEVDE